MARQAIARSKRVFNTFDHANAMRGTQSVVGSRESAMSLLARGEKVGMIEGDELVLLLVPLPDDARHFKFRFFYPADFDRLTEADFAGTHYFVREGAR